jgi:nucleotide-binding universal stress UspA family protein
MDVMIRILVAVDGSPHAKKAAKLAARFARELRGADITLVNVGHVPAIALGGPGETMIDLGGLDAGLEQAGRAILRESSEAFAGIDCPVTPVYRRGEPAAEILKAAEEAKAELIVMGSRGLGRIGGLFLGSVSERVLHAADIPVLIAR